MDEADTTPDAGDAPAETHRRGPADDRPAVADGGDEGASDETSASADRMRDVSHAPPHGDGTNDVWSRGDAAGDRNEPTRTDE
jgi:hypothetical protein